MTVAQISRSQIHTDKRSESLSTRIFDGLATIPPDWQLTPLNGNKAPQGDGWQMRPFSRSQMEAAILDGVVLPVKGKDTKIYPLGYGIITGTPIVRDGKTYYAIAIDLDGPSAHPKLLELSGGEELPQTVAFTSGRPGRSQHLFLGAEEFSATIATKKIKTGNTGDDGKLEQIEFRFKGCQSALPPSVHPLTGSYQWLPGCSPDHCKIAEAPMWVIDLISKTKPKPPAYKEQKALMDSVPLYNCLTRSDRALIDSGISEGGRNDAGAKLARNLIGTESRLQELGISFTGNARDLFDNYSDCCLPPLDAREADTIWNSALKDNPSPSLTDDALLNCASAFIGERSQSNARFSNANNLETSHKKYAKRELPPADIIAREIAREYHHRLAFNNDISMWMHYEAEQPGMWSIESDEFVESIVYKILDRDGINSYGSNSYVYNVVRFMRHQLILRRWLEKSPKELLPFKNGVLDIRTNKLLPHSPNYFLTWQLPRIHNPLACNWSKIDEFLDHLTCHNKVMKEVLLCYCNAVLKGRHDLQKFLHLIGLGGTGKGTFARLLESLIGTQNVHSTNLDEWCGNRFEGANAYHKRLVLFPDEDKQTGKLGKFLSLTGEDLIQAEEKGKKAISYRYDGMVLVLSNLPVFSGDAAARVKRRVITVPCNNVVPECKRRNLEVEFTQELDAFTNHVLSIPDDKVTEVLRGVGKIPEITLEFWNNRIQVDSIAGWLNNYVIYDPMAEIAVGCDRTEGMDGDNIVTLFGSYNKYCRGSGDSPKSHKNFSPDLLELCRSVLGWSVERKVTKTGKFVRGLRLRVPGADDHIPMHDFTLMQALSSQADSIGQEATSVVGMNHITESDRFSEFSSDSFNQASYSFTVPNLIVSGDGRGDGKGDGSQVSASSCFTQGDSLLPILNEKVNDLDMSPLMDLVTVFSSSTIEDNIDVIVEQSSNLESLSGEDSEPSSSLSPLSSPSMFRVGDRVKGKKTGKIGEVLSVTSAIIVLGVKVIKDGVEKIVRVRRTSSEVEFLAGDEEVKGALATISSFWNDSLNLIATVQQWTRSLFDAVVESLNHEQQQYLLANIGGCHSFVTNINV